MAAGRPRAGEAPWDGDAAFAADPARILAAARPGPGEADEPAVVLLEEESYSYDGAGRETYRYRVLARIAHPAAIDEWSSIDCSWSPWCEARPVLRARVIAPGGTAHELDPATISEAPAETESRRMYSDRKVLRAPLPAVTVGSVVEEEIRVVETRPFFEGGRTGIFELDRDVPVRRARLVLEAPSATPLRYEAAAGMKETRGEAGGRLRVAFEAGPLRPVPEPEPHLPPDAPRWPHVAFSTGRSWNDVAARYATLVDSQISGTDLDREIAAATGGATERREIIARVLAWVAREVRYEGVELGEASIVPRPPREVLERKYGDCKDQAALLVAMLRRAGVPARVALLSMGPGPDLAPELPGFGSFDHVIVQVPGPAPVWIDPTEKFARGGELPVEDQGRLALVASAETEALVRTPESGPRDNTIVEDREILIPESGPARVIETMEARGSFEIDYRADHAETDRETLRDDLEEHVRDSYRARRLDRWNASDPFDLSRPFRVRLEASGAGIVRRTAREVTVTLRSSGVTSELCACVAGDEDAEALDEGDGSEEGGGEFSGDGPEDAWERRSADFDLDLAHTITFRWRIVPPPGFSPVGLPASEDVRMGPARLLRSYEALKDGAVSATVSFEVGRRRISPAELDDLRSGVRAFLRKPTVRLRFARSGAPR